LGVVQLVGNGKEIRPYSGVGCGEIHHEPLDEITLVRVEPRE
jgi:hypothetical protein